MEKVIAATKATKKGTVLMIHGWAQNAKVMTYKSKSLTKRLNQAGYDCIFLQAPFDLPMTSTVKVDGELVTITNGERQDAKAWFLYSQEDACDASPALSGRFVEYVGLDDAIQVVETELNDLTTEDNPVIAMLGFSQGAVFAHIIAALANQTTRPFHKINRFILVSGFPATPGSLPPSLEDKKQLLQINKPSLHVIGLNDTSVPPSMSTKLSDCFVNPKTMHHEKGHLLAQQSAQCAQIIQFLDGRT